MHAWSLTAQVGKKASKSEKYGVRYITEEKEMKREADPSGKEEAVSAQKVGLLKTAKHTRSFLLSSSLLSNRLSWKV